MKDLDSNKWGEIYDMGQGHCALGWLLAITNVEPPKPYVREKSWPKDHDTTVILHEVEYDGCDIQAVFKIPAGMDMEWWYTDYEKAKAAGTVGKKTFADVLREAGYIEIKYEEFVVE